MTRCAALIVAAGRGSRLKGRVPKQYRPLGGEPLLRRSLAAFAGHPAIAAVKVAIHPDDRALYDAATRGLPLLDPVMGGATRQESVWRGLESLASAPPDLVLIHDAARPFVDHALIHRLIAALGERAGAIAALPLADTLKQASDTAPSPVVATTVDRTGLWRAQTPQGFRFPVILDAHRRARSDALGREFTDDAAVAEWAGIEVALVMGSEGNFKVTTEDDLARAERLVSGEDQNEYRTGFGFDVHGFEPGDHVFLCGVKIPFEKKLKGHSDADVGLHAATDAILGALGEGDIGVHFPPSDARWKNAPSHLFLARAAELLEKRGGALANLDVTLICEAPRIGPHRAEMVTRLAQILRVPEARVGVKATTTEGLGFTGRGEGIAAQAVATVRLPRRAGGDS